jgi:GT2 family glycosyltransferase
VYERLTELIRQGDFQEALYEFQDEYFHIDERSFSDAGKLCVLEATLWESLRDCVAEFDALTKACQYDYGNYEIYYMLALYYMDINIDKAYLCMEMALHYCTDQEDRAVIESSFVELKSTGRVRVRNVSVMILSYNEPELLKKCITSVEENIPQGAFEIVVVDNASTELKTLDYLRSKRDTADYPFLLIENPENYGFSAGCNIGAANCNPENDIFFLNNDAILTPNAMFWLRMALYEDRNVGAAGAMSNSASLQEIDKSALIEFFLGKKDGDKDKIDSVLKVLQDADDEKTPWHKRLPLDQAIWAFEQYAASHCAPLRNPYIRSFRLTGFAVLVSRAAILELAREGQVFDEYFSPAYFEDDDLGIRIARAGFKQYLCKNSLIYHNGGGFGGNNEAMEKGREKFIQKWGFDIWNYSMPWIETCDRILELAAEKKGVLRVADFTCDFGANAAYLKSTFPDIYVAGVCNNPFAAGIAHNIVDDVIYGDLNCIRIPWPEHSFDVVIAEKKNVSKGQIGRCLKADGTTFLYEE